MEVNKEQARTEQESRTAELQADMEIKQAEAQKKSAIGQNNAEMCIRDRGYSFLNMKPMQIDCKLTGAISKQNIRVDVPTTITVAVSTEPEVMQNGSSFTITRRRSSLSTCV